MNRFYLLVLNNHIILCLQNYHITSFVDITAKRRRHHPSSDVSPPYARYILGGGGAGSGNHSLPRPYTMASKLVRWVEARAKLDALYADFIGRGAVFHSLPLMSLAFSILIEMENLQQITTRNTAVFQELSLHESARSWYLVSSIHGTLLFSPPMVQ